MIDLRSDTVTKPSLEMRKFMANAVVGDDVFGEDKTVIELQNYVTNLFNVEAGLFVPTGVMSNQISIKVNTNSGDEIICDENAHIFNYETSAPSILSNVQIKTIPAKFGILSADIIKDSIRQNIYYLPKTSLICLENTHNRGGGSIYPMEVIKNIFRLAKNNKINLHLDGARIWNASISSGIKLRDYAKYFNTISVCFSKGLGAPVGSMILGKKEVIEKAKKWRKIFGGGMRQVGIIASAALFAVKNNYNRLTIDHENAKYFSIEISNCKNISIFNSKVETNIVLIDITKTNKSVEENISLLKNAGLNLSYGTNKLLRAVFHLDVSKSDVKKAISIFRKIYK